MPGLAVDVQLVEATVGTEEDHVLHLGQLSVTRETGDGQATHEVLNLVESAFGECSVFPFCLDVFVGHEVLVVGRVVDQVFDYQLTCADRVVLLELGEFGLEVPEELITWRSSGVGNHAATGICYLVCRWQDDDEHVVSVLDLVLVARQGHWVAFSVQDRVVDLVQDYTVVLLAHFLEALCSLVVGELDVRGDISTVLVAGLPDGGLLGVHGFLLFPTGVWVLE